MSQRRELVDNQDELSIRKQCELLSVHRSGLYYAPKGESQENLEIMRIMDEHYLKHPTEGVISMQDMLFVLGFLVNHKRVRRLLRLMGLMAIYPKKNLSKLYLTAIIDVYSRYIVGWGISNTLDADASLSVLKQAIKDHGKPEIINSDQGSQFTCEQWVNYLKKEDIRISMDGKGRAVDNIFIERFWRSLKWGYVYLHPANDGQELYYGVKEYILYYNHIRHHQGIDRRIPATLYKPAA